MKSHVNQDKPFKCHVCQRFKIKRYLNQHIKTKTETTSSMCDIYTKISSSTACSSSQQIRSNTRKKTSKKYVPQLCTDYENMCSKNEDQYISDSTKRQYTVTDCNQTGISGYYTLCQNGISTF